MAIEFQSISEDMSNVNLWYKVQGGDDLMLSDVSEIIYLRWNYFRDNWEKLKQTYIDAIETYSDPEKLRAEIKSFTDYINAQRNSQKTSNPFDDSDILLRFYTIFDTTPINNVSLTHEEEQIVQSKINNVMSFTRGSFLEIRGRIRAERDIIADKVGATDETYNDVFNRSPQPARVSIKNSDINKMFELNEAIKGIDFLLANSFSLARSIIDPFALARQNANNDEIEIDNYFSGTLEKINYGEDLQSLANRTLGDPDRWIDIAIANGLKAPYIDEKGQKIQLISNASGNQINIAEKDEFNNLNIDKLFVGQLVLLKSNSQNFPEQRSILNIKEVPVSGEIIIQLDGDADLDRYKLSEDAHIRIYKPNTINSGLYVLIPSTDTLDDNRELNEPWFLQASDVVEKRQKVDLSINEDGDLNFSSTGDLQLTYGLDNSVQAIRLKMSVEEGELRKHPEYGLVPVQGLTNTDIDEVRSLLVESINFNIENDERFSGLDTLDVYYSNPTTDTGAVGFLVSMVVTLSGSGQQVPITFAVNI